MLASNANPGANEVIHMEAALVAKDAIPDIETDSFKSEHLEMLNKKNNAFMAGRNQPDYPYGKVGAVA